MAESSAPNSEIVNRVLDAFLIFEPSELLASLAELTPPSPEQAAFVDGARDSLRSVISAGTLPYRLISQSVQQRRFDRFHSAEQIRSLAHHEPKPNGQLQEDASNLAYRNANERMREFVTSEEGLNATRDEIVYQLDYTLKSPDVSQAASELLIQTLISTWTVFESATRTLIISCINSDPRRANPVLESVDLKAYFGKQVVGMDVIGDHSFDLTRSMGNILFSDRRLDNLSVIRNVLEALYGDAAIRAALGDDMWMLNQRRHLFVHRRGIVDADYLKRTGEVIAVGERLPLTSGDAAHYVHAVQSAVKAIAAAKPNGGESAVSRELGQTSN